MDIGSCRGTLLDRCPQRNALALAFSLAHAIVEISRLASGSEMGEWSSTAIVALGCAGYAWWGWSMAQTARDGRSGLESLLALCGT